MHRYSVVAQKFPDVTFTTTVKPPRRGHFGTVAFVLCSEVVLFSEVALYNSLELLGESESRSRIWTQNTLCLLIFGRKPYVEKSREVVNSLPISRIDF